MSINILLDKLPKYTPSGVKIRTDFRNCIKFELLMQDTNIDLEKKIKLILNLFYEDISKFKNIEQAIYDIIWFYSGGKSYSDIQETIKKDKNNKKSKSKKQIYSFEYDSEHIFSAFWEQYHIDLNQINYFHWWKFKALFNDLNEETQFSKIMEYRAMDLSKIKDKSMKENFSNLKKQYALPDMRNTIEKEKDFAALFW